MRRRDAAEGSTTRIRRQFVSRQDRRHRPTEVRVRPLPRSRFASKSWQDIAGRCESREAIYRRWETRISLSSSCGRRRPQGAMARISSSRSSCNTPRTPAAPSRASPYRTGRPIPTARAPSASALTTSVPRRMRRRVAPERVRRQPPQRQAGHRARGQPAPMIGHVDPVGPKNSSAGFGRSRVIVPRG
jgi:hypothetical protein